VGVIGTTQYITGHNGDGDGAAYWGRCRILSFLLSLYCFHMASNPSKLLLLLVQHFCFVPVNHPPIG
jgi:hypothetical protein